MVKLAWTGARGRFCFTPERTEALGVGWVVNSGWGLGLAKQQVNKLEITPDKQYLAAAGNPHIRLFEVTTNNPQPVLSFDGHQGNVTAVGFERDCKWLFSGSEDGTVKLWDVRAQGCQREYESRAAVNTVVLHPNQVRPFVGVFRQAKRVCGVVGQASEHVRRHVSQTGQRRPLGRNFKVGIESTVPVPRPDAHLAAVGDHRVPKRRVRRAVGQWSSAAVNTVAVCCCSQLRTLQHRTTPSLLQRKQLRTSHLSRCPPLHDLCQQLPDVYDVGCVRTQKALCLRRACASSSSMRLVV